MRRFTMTAKIAIAFFGIACTIGATSASAGIIIVEDNTNVVSVIGITGFSTTGAQMAGMRVTTTFVGGLQEITFWGSTGPTSGQADGDFGDGVPETNWVLQQSGDTFSPSSDNWTLTTNHEETDIESILLEGLLGGTQGVVFDRTFGGLLGTDNSALGQDFDSSLFDLMDVTATYSNPIQIGANPAVGDLFGTLLIQFDTERLGFVGFNVFVNGGLFTFRQDTDAVGLPPNGRAPEPGSTLLLIGAGLVALYRRRRG